MSQRELGPEAFYIVLATGVLAGFISFWIFRRLSNPEKLRQAANLMWAHLLEFRLFADDPALVLRAQRDLFSANALLLRETIAPSLVLLLFFAPLMSGVDAVFGTAPIRIDEPAVVTVQCNRQSGGGAPDIHLSAPAGIQIETPPVHVPRLAQVSWRIRALRQTRGILRAELGTRTITKSISSRPNLQWLSPIRVNSLFETLRHPFELPFRDVEVRSIRVEYPSAKIFERSWILWFTLGTLLGATLSYVTK